MAHEASNYLLRVFAVPRTTSTSKHNERATTKVMALFDGHGNGAEMTSSKGTAFGLLNAVTEFVDHERAM